MITSTTGNILTIAFPPDGMVDDAGEPVKSRYFWSNRPHHHATPHDLNQHGWNIYTVLAGYRGNDRRASDIVGMQSVWADLDLVKHAAADADHDEVIGAGYTTLLAMVQEHNLPMPSSIVESGGGLHVYWGISEPVDVPRWLVLAGKVRLPFRRAFRKQYDGQCTIDAMRMMRTPGFINHRRGRVAELALPADGEAARLYSYDELVAAFGSIAPTPEDVAATLRMSGRAEHELVIGELLSSIGGERTRIQGSTFADAEPVERPGNWRLLRDGALQGAGCRLLAEVLRHGDVGYDLWSGIFSIAARTDDFDGAVTEIGSQWPDWGTKWTVDAVRERIESFNAPRTCEALRASFADRTGRNPCVGCPHGSGPHPIKTPLALAYPGRVALGEVAPAPVAQEQAAGGCALVQYAVADDRAPQRLPLPAATGGFEFERDAGGISRIVNSERLDGEDERHMVASPATWLVSHIRTTDETGNPFYRELWAVDARDKTEFHEVAPTPGIGAVGMFSSRLAGMGIRLNHNLHERVLSNMLSKFVRHQHHDMEQLRNAAVRPLIAHNGTAGVSDTSQFILGEHIYGRDGSVMRGYIPMASQKLINPVEPPTPDQVPEIVEAWNDHLRRCFGPAPTIGGDRNTAARVCAALVFGAPLMPMLQLGGDLGGAVMLFTPDSGMGKTTILQLLLSMYGKRTTLEISDGTVGSAGERVFANSTLPLHYNDAQRMLSLSRDKDAASKFLLSVTDLSARARMTDTYEDRMRFRNTFSFMSTNEDFVAHATRTSRSDASIARVLRVPMLSLSERERAVSTQTVANFVEFTTWADRTAGKIGHLWVRYAVMNQTAMAKRAAAWRARLMEDEPALADTRWRFVVNMAICGMVGSEMATAAGLLPFDVEDTYQAIRNAAGGSVDRRDNLMAEQGHQLNQLVNLLVKSTLVRDTGAVGFDVDARALQAIEARIYPKERRMAIPRAALAPLASRYNLNLQTLLDEISHNGGRVEWRDIAEGLPQASGTQACMVFDLAPISSTATAAAKP